MGFLIKKSYKRNSEPLESFYARIEMYVVDRLAGTAYALIQYYRDAESAKGYSNKYSRETHSPDLSNIPAESFPLPIDEETEIGGQLFTLEPQFADFRVQSYGFYFPLGEMVKEERHEFEEVETEIEQKYIDFDDDGNPVEKIKKTPLLEKRIVSTEIVERCVANHQLPEFQQNPSAWLYKKLKPELEKIFGEGTIEDAI
jgi:hypothetical protein